ncbi:MAG: aspartyl-phosphate phosphatase Spo0E family protein [Clostridioides sp.]|jgi:hypothetical protein|nr:aspartyl-phosphate phosphatase Spo0E family protein [Clostridioides sp.]
MNQENNRNRQIKLLKDEIESVRSELDTYIEYPDIFQEELIISSKKINALINKYLILTKE